MALFPCLSTFINNSINELLTVTDVADNETNYTYDLLGRKLTYDHPDAGLVEYSYDNAGNLLRKVTPNIRNTFEGEAIEYTYDYERLTKIDYPENYQNYVRFTYGSPEDTLYNRVGRVYLQEDPSGAQEHYFGILGETEKTVRTIVVNTLNIQTYISEAEYDTWNRIQTMTYPDGELVDYSYNEAGKLQSVSSVKGDHNYNILDNIRYDEFEDRVELEHGNGVKTTYSYESDRRRLSALRTTASGGRLIMNNSYDYDNMDNIMSIDNQASAASSGQLGGPSDGSYMYDDLYRLTWASGSYTGAERNDNYTLTVEYDLQHNIVSKNQDHFTDGEIAGGTSYQNDYVYEDERPHVPTAAGQYLQTYDDNGNLKVSHNGFQEPTLNEYVQYEWDEENRLESVSTNGAISRYTYDAQGERVIKSHGNIEGVFVNGAMTGFVNHQDNYTLYVSPYMVVQDERFTKHYFIEGQRVLSKIGTGEFQKGGALGASIYTAGAINFEDKLDSLNQAYTEYLEEVGATPWHPTLTNQNLDPTVTGVSIDANSDAMYSDPPQDWPNPYGDPNDATGTGGLGVEIPLVPADSLTAGYLFTETSEEAENDRYFYHSDHLGSTGYITNGGGDVIQHTEYLPFGEALVDEHDTDSRQPYLFNGKERDDLTGLYYYGARYYNPETSIWLSVDPVSDLAPEISPFRFGFNNPIRYSDPDGLWEEDSQGNLTAQKGDSHITLGTVLGIDEAEAKSMYYNFDNWKKHDNGSTKIGTGGTLKITDPGMKVGNLAAHNIGSTDWNTTQKWNGDPYYKCNLFVADMAKAAGADPGTPNGRLGHLPPTSEQWANPSFDIPGWRVLRPNEVPRRGDVAAYKNIGRHSRGHVGIVTGLAKYTGTSGRNKKISTSSEETFRRGKSLTHRRFVGHR